MAIWKVNFKIRFYISGALQCSTNTTAIIFSVNLHLVLYKYNCDYFLIVKNSSFAWRIGHYRIPTRALEGIGPINMIFP